MRASTYLRDSLDCQMFSRSLFRRAIRCYRTAEFRSIIFSDDDSLFMLTFQVLLTKFTSLPPLFENTPNAAQELTLASIMFLSFSLLAPAST